MPSGSRLSNRDLSATLLASNPAHLAFAKSAKRAELLGRFNRALAEMKQDGTLARLIARELARSTH